MIWPQERTELCKDTLTGLNSYPAAPNHGVLWGNRSRGLLAKLWRFLRPELMIFIQSQVLFGSSLMRTTAEELGSEGMNCWLWPRWRPEFWMECFDGMSLWAVSSSHQNIRLKIELKIIVGIQKLKQLICIILLCNNNRIKYI